VRGKQVYRPKRVFAVALKLAQEVERKKGSGVKPPTRPDHLYLALLVLRSYGTEAFFRDLFRDKP